MHSTDAGQKTAAQVTDTLKRERRTHREEYEKACAGKRSLNTLRPVQRLCDLLPDRRVVAGPRPWFWDGWIGNVASWEESGS